MMSTSLTLRRLIELLYRALSALAEDKRLHSTTTAVLEGVAEEFLDIIEGNAVLNDSFNELRLEDDCYGEED